MKAYSIDLRERVIHSWENGRGQMWIASEFEVGISTVKRWINLYKQTGSVEACQQARMKPTIQAHDLAAIQAMVDGEPDASLGHYIEQWARGHGVVVSQATMCRALQRANRPKKKDAQGHRTRRG